jgi:hypothetical protein
MKSSINSLRCFGLIVIWFFSCTQNIYQGNTGTIRGKVIDANGNPISRVNIQLIDHDRWVYSSDSGKFIFHDLPQGSFTLGLFAFNNHIPDTNISFNLDYGEDLDIGTIK